MTRILSLLCFVLALSSSAVAQNPFQETEPNPVKAGSYLGIEYRSSRTESSVEVKIYDHGEDLIDTITIQLTDGDGSASWWVDESLDEFITLEDKWGNSKLINIDEG